MPINNILTDFYSRGLLPGDHKANIDALDTQKRKAEYLLDYVIKPGLKVGYTGQFDKMLRVMETSDDPAVKFVAEEIVIPPKHDSAADSREISGAGNAGEFCLRLTFYNMLIASRENLVSYIFAPPQHALYTTINVKLHLLHSPRGMDQWGLVRLLLELYSSLVGIL